MMAISKKKKKLHKDLVFFSWNVRNSKNLSVFKKLNYHLKVNLVDIVVFQEFTNDECLPSLLDYYEVPDFLIDPGRRWVRIFIRKSSGISYSDATSYVNNKLRCLVVEKSGVRINVAGVHMYSKNRSERHQELENISIRESIDEFENKVGLQKTIIVGDLNLTPFDTHMMGAEYFNATSSKAIIRKFKHRVLPNGNSKFLYNPMWNLFGDYDYVRDVEKVDGTYYWYPEDVAHYHWNLLDGVLLSEPIMDNICLKSLRIVHRLETTNGYYNLLKPNITNENDTAIIDDITDHLPITFKLNLNE